MGIGNSSSKSISLEAKKEIVETVKEVIEKENVDEAQEQEESLKMTIEKVASVLEKRFGDSFVTESVKKLIKKTILDLGKENKENHRDSLLKRFSSSLNFKGSFEVPEKIRTPWNMFVKGDLHHKHIFEICSILEELDIELKKFQNYNNNLFHFMIFIKEPVQSHESFFSFDIEKFISRVQQKVENLFYKRPEVRIERSKHLENANDDCDFLAESEAKSPNSSLDLEKL